MMLDRQDSIYCVSKLWNEVRVHILNYSHILPYLYIKQDDNKINS